MTPPQFPPALLALGDFAFIDVETTGMKPLVDRVTEIAIIRFSASGGSERWQSLINPGVAIPAEIQALTGITNAMVRNAPSFFAVRTEVRRLLEGAVFVAHNARFDYGFIIRGPPAPQQADLEPSRHPDRSAQLVNLATTPPSPRPTVPLRRPRRAPISAAVVLGPALSAA